MRRWRTDDDRFLIEGDLPSGVQFYRLGRTFEVERVFREEKRSLAGEFHQITFTVLGRQLMSRHTIDRGRKIDDESRVELDKLELLMPTEEPTERTVRESLARHRLGAETVEAAKRSKVEKLAEAAPKSIRPTFRRLAEGVVLQGDPHCRQLISMFSALAQIAKDGEEGAALSRQVTPMIELAAQLLTSDPRAKKAELPSVPETKEMLLADAIERLRAELIEASDGEHEERFEKTASVLRAASVKLIESRCLTESK